MRGKGHRSDRAAFWRRITPAYAGKRDLFFCEIAPAEDHPRLCGEKPPVQIPHGEYMGSPPPMRGKGEIVKTMVGDTGITPAYAGKRVALHLHIGFRRDHPRLCGEKALWWRSLAAKPGSPPPMRGKGAEGGTNLRNIRITPAYAGKRTPSFVLLLHFRDHPRLCGEKKSTHATMTHFTGSPPPMRGKGKCSTTPHTA